MATTTQLTETAENLKPILGALSSADRLALAHFLYDSVEMEELTDEEYRAEWTAELNRRIKETEMGIGEEIPAEEVHRIIRESLS